MEHFLATQQSIMRAFLSAHPDSAAGARNFAAASESPTGVEACADNAKDEMSKPAAHTAEGCLSEKEQRSQPSTDGRSSAHLRDDAVHSAPLNSPEEFQHTFLNVIAEKTGYPLAMLDPKLDLEADLGVDSIKRIEILGALQRITGVPRAEDMDAVSKLKTVQQIVEFLAQPSSRTASRGVIALPDSGPRCFPLLGDVSAAIQGDELQTTLELNLKEHLFLRDHTLGAQVSAADPDLRGLPVLPLTFSMEIMAEAAAALRPGEVVTRMEQIRAHRWIKIESDIIVLRVSARCSKPSASRCEVRLHIAGDGSAVLRSIPEIAVVEGVVVMSDRYPVAPTAAEFSLSAARPSKWTQAELYSGYMFHGPSLQGVSAMGLCGEDGSVATLQTPPLQGLLQSVAEPEFLTDPVMLDAAGQVIAYWLGERLTHAFHIFPFKLEALELYGGSAKAGQQTECRARISLVGDSQLRSDIDLVREGRTIARMLGWRDKRFHLPDRFYRLRTSPQRIFLSDPWILPTSLDLPDGLFCARLEVLPVDLLESSAGVWQSVLAHLVLSARERNQWLELRGTERRRIDWLLGRTVAKDAVRMLLARRYGWDIFPADVEITQDARGQPGVLLIGERQLSRPLRISIAHVEGIAIAAAAEDDKVSGVGVDIERVGRAGVDFHDLAFATEERGLLSTLDASESEEWALRLWCAKEAVAKALGVGMPGGPTELLARKIEPSTGQVDIVRSQKFAQYSGGDTNNYQACTVRERDLVAATSILARS
jgi:phosphopantetheinyl transferase/acyl carrier protein